MNEIDHPRLVVDNHRQCEVEELVFVNCTTICSALKELLARLCKLRTFMTSVCTTITPTHTKSAMAKLTSTYYQNTVAIR